MRWKPFRDHVRPGCCAAYCYEKVLDDFDIIYSVYKAVHVDKLCFQIDKELAKL